MMCSERRTFQGQYRIDLVMHPHEASIAANLLLRALHAVARPAHNWHAYRKTAAAYNGAIVYESRFFQSRSPCACCATRLSHDAQRSRPEARPWQGPWPAPSPCGL